MKMCGKVFPKNYEMRDDRVVIEKKRNQHGKTKRLAFIQHVTGRFIIVPNKLRTYLANYYYDLLVASYYLLVSSS